jgi:hypothetical protein
MPGAWLAVECGGRLLYICADDLDTGNRLTLLNAIFASLVGEATGAKPLHMNKRQRVIPL